MPELALITNENKAQKNIDESSVTCLVTCFTNLYKRLSLFVQYRCKSAKTFK